MNDNRKIWQDLLFSQEIEGGFANRPLAEDPGGLTNHGITRAALADWRDVQVNAITEADMRALTLDDAKAIASASYWNPPRCNDLIGGLDVFVADFAFNSGPRQAVKTLQRTLGFQGDDVDGFVGPMTLTAAGKRDPVELINSYHDARLLFLRGLKNWEANKNGWANRCAKMRDLALKMAPQQAPAAVAKQDSVNRNLAAWVAAGATGFSTIVPAIIEALPEAQQVYAKVGEVLSPTVLAGLPWLIPALGVVAMLGVLFLKVRSSTMASNAEKTGTTAPIVAGKDGRS